MRRLLLGVAALQLAACGLAEGTKPDIDALIDTIGRDNISGDIYVTDCAP